jgi:hypothetical protein
MGYFEVEVATKAKDLSDDRLQALFGANSHVRHREIFDQQKNRLVLVKGTQDSRLLSRACKISEYSKDRQGRPIKVISREMQQIFGDFDGKTSIQRSSPRWIYPAHVDKAVTFIRSRQFSETFGFT